MNPNQLYILVYLPFRLGAGACGVVMSEDSEEPEAAMVSSRSLLAMT
jgi:hypothetical protein